MTGLFIFVTAIAASLFWLWLGGFDYIKEESSDIVKLDEEDKKHIQ